MSIYSGFATRNLETLYNRGVCQLLHLCQMSLVSLLKKGKNYLETVNLPSLSRSFNKTFKNLKSLEQHKHLEPKFSEYCLELASHLGYEETSLSHGVPSQTTLNSDLDFHILNDVLAYDNSRIAPNKLVKRKITPNVKIPRRTATSNEMKRDSKKYLKYEDKPARVSSTRMTPNIFESGSTRSYHSVSKNKKGKKIDPAQLYHDQAMSLIYSAIEG